MNYSHNGESTYHWQEDRPFKADSWLSYGGLKVRKKKRDGVSSLDPALISTD